jgi:hypothetical protein
MKTTGCQSDLQLYFVRNNHYRLSEVSEHPRVELESRKIDRLEYIILANMPLTPSDSLLQKLLISGRYETNGTRRRFVGRHDGCGRA